VTFPDADDLDPNSPDVGGHLTHDEEQHVLAVEGLALLISRAFDLHNIRRVPHTAGLALPVLPRRRSAHPDGVTAHPHPLDADSGGLRATPADGYASPKISLPLAGPNAEPALLPERHQGVGIRRVEAYQPRE
jgi:hypothetical protein